METTSQPHGNVCRSKQLNSTCRKLQICTDQKMVLINLTEPQELFSLPIISHSKAFPSKFLPLTNHLLTKHLTVLSPLLPLISMQKENIPPNQFARGLLSSMQTASESVLESETYFVHTRRYEELCATTTTALCSCPLPCTTAAHAGLQHTASSASCQGGHSRLGDRDPLP